MIGAHHIVDSLREAHRHKYEEEDETTEEEEWQLLYRKSLMVIVGWNCYDVVVAARNDFMTEFPDWSGGFVLLAVSIAYLCVATVR